MNTLKSFIFATATATATAIALVSTLVPVTAAQAATTPAAASTDAVVAQATATDMTEGEVRKIDKEAGKITLKHGEIKNLDMPGMTMVFTVKDKAMLDKLQAGDKVKFKAMSDGGKLTITQIDNAK